MAERLILLDNGEGHMNDRRRSLSLALAGVFASVAVASRGEAEEKHTPRPEASAESSTPQKDEPTAAPPRREEEQQRGTSFGLNPTAPWPRVKPPALPSSNSTQQRR